MAQQTATTTLEKDDAIPREVWRVAFVVVLGAFMAGLDTSLVNVGLSTISRELHSTLAATQWVTSGYLVALAAVLPISSWLSRRIGAGRLWLGALVVFTLASALCALAPNLGFLVVTRLLQGAAGGLLVPAGQTILGGVAGPSRMGRVMNTAGTAVVLAPAIGPAVGGLMIASLSWHWLFLLNIPIGVVALVLGLRFIPRGETGTAGKLDTLGLVLLSTGLPLVTYGIIAGTSDRSITTSSVLATLPLGVLALTGFALHVRHANRLGEPLIVDVTLLRDRVYAAAQGTVFFTGARLFGGLIILPLYFEQLRGKGVVGTGLLLLSYGAGAALALRQGGKLTDRIGGGPTVTIGLIVVIATTVPFVFLPGNASLILVEVLMFLRGTGVSFSGLPAMSSAFAAVTRDELPDATATANMLQRIGGSLGSALFVVVLTDFHPIDITAFHTVFAALTATAVLALAASLWLTLEQRRTRT